MTGSTNSSGASGSTDGNATASANKGKNGKGHRRQESMYAMTGLYSETVPEEDSTAASTELQKSSHSTSGNFCHDSVIKCHSRNPSAVGFDK